MDSENCSVSFPFPFQRVHKHDILWNHKGLLTGNHGSPVHQSCLFSDLPTRYHHFLSHDWETSGTKKVSSVLLLTNSLAACLATMFCSVLLGLVRDTRRPEGLRPQRQVAPGVIISPHFGEDLWWCNRGNYPRMVQLFVTIQMGEVPWFFEIGEVAPLYWFWGPHGSPDTLGC